MPSTAPADMLIFRHHIYLDDFRLWQWSGICHFRAHLRVAGILSAIALACPAFNLVYNFKFRRNIK